MSKSARHLSVVTVLTIISTFLVYIILSGRFIGWGFLELPEQSSREAVIIDGLMDGHFILIGFLFSIIVVPSTYSFWAFRRREGDDTDAPHVHSNTTLEIAWTVLPILLVIGFGIWGLQTYDAVIAEQPGEVTIRAQARKWDWVFFYPELENRPDLSLVVQVNTPVKVEMQSSDVLHAFWVPEFRVKQDVVPYNTLIRDLSFENEDFEAVAAEEGYVPQVIRFTPTQEGIYRLRCAEICGTDHYAMLANVFVLSPAMYQQWLDDELVLPADPGSGNTQPRDEGYFLNELQAFARETGLEMR